MALGGVLLAGAPLAQTFEQGDPAAGRALAGQCRTCHGLDGFAQIPIAPHIGGEPAAYLARQLAAFRDGTRQHEMMSVVARSLTDAQIADLSAWYASHVAEATLTVDQGDAPAQCTACHGANGIAVAADGPHLAGESAIYIETQLKAFRGGKRTHESMSEIAAGLDDAKIRELADWYAAIELTILPPGD